MSCSVQPSASRASVAPRPLGPAAIRPFRPRAGICRGFADGFEQLRIMRLQDLLPQPDYLDLKAPVVAVVKHELQLGAHGGNA